MSKLIVFEGVDNSGKTTASKLVAEALGWAWNKEPRFSTEIADQLNAMGSTITEREREELFYKSRIEAQETYSQNTILDRYTWTGLAYAKVFSPSVYHDYIPSYSPGNGLFKDPDAFVFLDTDLEVCLQREPAVGLQRLERIREAYEATRPLFWTIPIITISQPKRAIMTPEQIRDLVVAELQITGVISRLETIL